MYESVVRDNARLKQRIDEFASHEKRLLELNASLQRQVDECEHQRSRSGSSSSSSGGSNETVISTSVYIEQIRNLNVDNEQLKKDYEDLREKYDYEKTELQTIVEQLREDNSELARLKQMRASKDGCLNGDGLFVFDSLVGLSEEDSSLEEVLRSEFEFELKKKLDDLQRILKEDYEAKMVDYRTRQETLEHDLQGLTTSSKQMLDKQAADFEQELTRSQLKHEQQMNELNNELDRLKAHGMLTRAA